MFKTALLAVAGVLLSCGMAEASTCSGYTYSFSPNTPADAAAVNGNFNYILNCANNQLAPIASPSFTGNVGIGTSSPGYETEVYGPTPWLALNRSSGTGNDAFVLEFGGAPQSYIGLVGTAGALVTGAAVNDVVVRAQGSNILFSTNSGVSAALDITNGGNVGIGTTSPGTTLTVVGDIKVGTSGTNGCVENFAGSALTGTCSSDAALKNFVGNVDGILDRFENLQLVKFYWNGEAAAVYHNSTTVLNTGFIAQAVEKQFPELVTFDKHGYRQLDYTTLSLYGLEATKELKARNDAQSAEIADLKARLDREDHRLARLEARMDVQVTNNSSLDHARYTPTP